MSYQWRAMKQLIDTDGCATSWMKDHNTFIISGPGRHGASFQYIKDGYQGYFVLNAVPATPLAVRLFNLTAEYRAVQNHNA